MAGKFRRRSSSFFRSFKNTEPETETQFYFDRGATAAAQNRWVFEVAWEVANKGKNCLCVELSFFDIANIIFLWPSEICDLCTYVSITKSSRLRFR